MTVEQLEDGTLEADCTIVDGTAEDTKYQWYAREAFTEKGYAKETAQPVEGAVSKTYQPTEEDAGKLFSCEVTPMDGTKAGEPVCSEEILVNALLVDDTNGQIIYSEGAIHDTADAAYLAGNEPYENTISYFYEMKIAFNGTGIVWIGGHDQTERMADAAVDESEASQVTISGSSDGGWDFNQYKLYEASGLEAGDHTLKIGNVQGGNGYGNVDAFMILNPGAAQPDAEEMEEPAEPEEVPQEPAETPNVTEPESPETPDVTEPESPETPDVEEPGTAEQDAPETETPETENPDVPEIPDAETPDTDKPEISEETKPETPAEDTAPTETVESAEPAGTELLPQAKAVSRELTLVAAAPAEDEVAQATVELQAAIQEFKDSLVKISVDPGEEPDDRPDEKPDGKPDNKPGDNTEQKPGGGSGSGSGSSGGTKNQTSSVTSAQTGDNAPIGLFAGIGILAAAGVALVLWKRKKSQGN